MKQIKQNLIAILAGLTVFSGIAYAAITSPVYQDTNAEIVDVNVINEQNIIRVCKDRCRYSVIQDAVDAVTGATADNRWIIRVGPGVYEENVVLTSYISLVGEGGGQESIIRSTSGTTLTLSSDENNVSFMTIQSRPTASGAIALSAPSGGIHIIFTCWIDTQSDSNGITGTVLSMASDSFLTVSETIGFYLMTGSAAGVNTHNIIDLQGASELIYARSEITGAAADVDDTFNVFNINTTGDVIPANFSNGFQHLNPAFTGTVNLFKHTKNIGSKFDGQSFFQLYGSGSGTGNIFYIDSDTDNAVITSNRNTAIVLGFTNNYFANVATGDTLNSESDAITAPEGTTGAGIVNFANTQEYAQLEITGGGLFAINTQNEWHAFPSFTTGIYSSNLEAMPGSTGVITAVANNGGILRVTDAAHGLSTGDYVTLTGMGDPNHNGVTRVTVIGVDTFDCDNIAFSSSPDTGTWQQGSYIKANVRGAYNVNYAISVVSATANQLFDFTAFNGITSVPGTGIKRKFAVSGDQGSVAGTGVVFLEKGDVLWFATLNETSAGDVTIAEGSLNVNKSS